MVALNKTYRKTLTPDRSAKDSGHRYYSPDGVSRWLSRDPIGENGGINVYGFVGNDAIDACDILGLRIVYMITEQYFLQMSALHERTLVEVLYPEGASGEERVVIRRAEGQRSFQESIDRDIRNFVDRLRNAGASQDLITELTPEYHRVASVDDVIAVAGQSNPGDHFILHGHGSGDEQRRGTMDFIHPDPYQGGTYGGSRGIRFGNDLVVTWDSRDMRRMLDAFSRRCADLTLMVCRVSTRRAGWLYEQLGRRPVYYTQEFLGYERIENSGVFFPDTSTETAIPVFDPIRATRGRLTRWPPPPSERLTPPSRLRGRQR